MAGLLKLLGLRGEEEFVDPDLVPLIRITPMDTLAMKKHLDDAVVKVGYPVLCNKCWH
jgi:hypothetical protein